MRYKGFKNVIVFLHSFPCFTVYTSISTSIFWLLIDSWVNFKHRIRNIMEFWGQYNYTLLLKLSITLKKNLFKSFVFLSSSLIVSSSFSEIILLHELIFSDNADLKTRTAHHLHIFLILISILFFLFLSWYAVMVLLVKSKYCAQICLVDKNF